MIFKQNKTTKNCIEIIKFILLVIIIYLLFNYQGYLVGDSVTTLRGVNGNELITNFKGWIPSRVIDGVLSGYMHKFAFLILDNFTNYDFFEGHRVITTFYYSVLIVVLSYLIANFFSEKFYNKNFIHILLICLILTNLISLSGYNLLFAYSFPALFITLVIKLVYFPLSFDKKLFYENSNRLNYNFFIFLLIYLIAFSIEHYIFFMIIFIFYYYLFNVILLKLNISVLKNNLFDQDKVRFFYSISFFIFSIISLLISFFYSVRAKHAFQIEANYFYDLNLNYLTNSPLLQNKIYVIILIFLFINFFLLYKKIFLYFVKNKKKISFIFFVLVSYYISLIFLSHLINKDMMKGRDLYPFTIIFFAAVNHLIIKFYHFTNKINKKILVFIFFIYGIFLFNSSIDKNFSKKNFVEDYKMAFHEGLKACKDGKDKIFINTTPNFKNLGYPILPNMEKNDWFKNAYRQIYYKYYNCKFSVEGPTFIFLK